MCGVNRAAAVALALVSLALTGCGRERLSTPPVGQPGPPGGVRVGQFAGQGVKFLAPKTWSLRGGGGNPLVATVTSGTATIAVWRYLRVEPLPRERAELEAAEPRLLEAVRQRDPTFREISSRLVEVDGAPGIELIGRAASEGGPRRVRSTHVFAKGAEFVIDAYAAERHFDRANRLAFGPLLRSFKIDPPTE
jgi:hypothetical protein